MSKTRAEIKAIAIRNGNIPTSYIGIDEDTNIGCQLIASLRDWSELNRVGTPLSLTAADGDITYSLDANVDKITQVWISSPASYARVLEEIDHRSFRRLIPDKTIPGPSTPNRWYYSESSIGTDNVETKQISFNSRPDRAYAVTYSYKSDAPEMDDDTDYPFFDGNYHHILANYDVWKYAERSADPALNPIYWRGEWENGVKELLANYASKSTLLLPVPGPDWQTP